LYSPDLCDSNAYFFVLIRAVFIELYIIYYASTSDRLFWHFWEINMLITYSIVNNKSVYLWYYTVYCTLQTCQTLDPYLWKPMPFAIITMGLWVPSRVCASAHPNLIHFHPISPYLIALYLISLHSYLIPYLISFHILSHILSLCICRLCLYNYIITTT
jgi:hypothetical protein